MKHILSLATCIVVGGAIAWITTCIVWNLQIEGRAYQCMDSIPFATFETDMSAHREAGDTLSPGWSWERIESAGRAYRVGLFVLWIFLAVLFSKLWSSRRLLK